LAARDLMTEATRWQWAKTDPTTGAILDVTSDRYTPPTLLRDLKASAAAPAQRPRPN